MTPRMLAWVIEGYERRRAWAAWHAAYPQSVKKPRFEDLLRPRRPKAMDPEKMKSTLRSFAERWNRQFEKGE